MVASVSLVELDDGRQVVAKQSADTPLSVEAAMLRYLAENTALPVPAVLHSSDELLLLEYVENDDRLGPSVEEHAAELLAELHSASSPAGQFGFETDTLIGPFVQVNTWSSSWPGFFRERRLLPMLDVCRERGRLDASALESVETIAADLEELLDHAPVPGLVHGDVWGGNVLVRDGRVVAFLDPAIYFADPEVELAFIDLVSTFGEAFWTHYRGLRPVVPGYREVRRDVYQLYPLLVHVALFGGAYVDALGERVRRLGY